MRGADGRVQGNKGGREWEGVGRVREEVFVFGMCRSLIGNDQTNTNSLCWHSMPASCRLFPPSICSLLLPLLSAHLPVCTPLPSALARAQKVRTIPMPLSIRSPPPFAQAASLAPFTPLSLVARQPFCTLSVSLREGHRNGTASPLPHPIHLGYATLTLVYAPSHAPSFCGSARLFPFKPGFTSTPLTLTQGSATCKGAREQWGCVQGEEV